MNQIPKIMFGQCGQVALTDLLQGFVVAGAQALSPPTHKDARRPEETPC